MRCSGSGGFELEFEVRQHAEQRVVNLVRCAEGKLGESRIFLVFGQLRLELDLVFV
jgi:hypothetical protein